MYYSTIIGQKQAFDRIFPAERENSDFYNKIVLVPSLVT